MQFIANSELHVVRLNIVYIYSYTGEYSVPPFEPLHSLKNHVLYHASCMMIKLFTVKDINTFSRKDLLFRSFARPLLCYDFNGTKTCKQQGLLNSEYSNPGFLQQCTVC